jgi:hypothetical protein
MSRFSAANVLAGIGSPDGVRQRFETLGRGLELRVEAANAEPHERRFETSHQPGRLGDQCLALPARTLGILLGQCRHSHHLAMAPLAAEPAEERSLEQLRVEPVGLGAAMLARHGNARGMDDVRLYALREEPACQPEAVVAGFEGYCDATDPVASPLSFRSPLLQQLQQRVRIDRKLLQWLPLDAWNNTAHEPARLAHLQHRDQRPVHFQGYERAAQIVYNLGSALSHRGGLHRLGSRSDGYLSTLQPA